MLRRAGVVLALALLASALSTSTARAASGCATSSPGGGEWRSLNHDFSNTRSQPDEHTIGTREAKHLAPAWVFRATPLGITGGMRTTPIIAGGCVYIAFGMGYLGDRGDVVALNADTGAVVWHQRIDGSILGLAVRNGLVYATPSKGTRGAVALPVVTGDYQPAGSYAIALDAETGKRVWTSQRLDDGNSHNGTFINASPVAFEAGGRELLFVPLAGGAGDGARVPMYFLDALTGETVNRAYSLTDGEYRQGFGGTGIWSTAAYSPRTQLLYAGTADSDGYTKQHRYNDAILKIDANPTRRTFGKVVGSYRGITEHANLDAVANRNPACGALAGDTAVQLPTFFDTSASPECLELDFDFGGSPNLFVGADGRVKVTALQKSGVVHTVDAATMKADWRFLTGVGGFAMDGASAALEGNALVVAATPNALFRLDRDTGAVRWLSQSGVDAFSYQPVTAANGVVYKINNVGVLTAVATKSGLPVTNRVIALDGGFRQCIGVGAGVAVARHMVFVPCDAGGLNDLAGLPSQAGGLVAYRVAG